MSDSISLCQVCWGFRVLYVDYGYCILVILWLMYFNFLNLVLSDFRCTFGSERCRDGTLRPTLTDLGVCYTFNNDPKNQLVSNASGW